MFPPTEQQVAIVDQSTKMETFKGEARAGTGKTATGVFVAERNQYLRIMLMVFNKAAQRESEDRMPPNTESVTSHKVAHDAIIKPRNLSKRLKDANITALVMAIEETKLVAKTTEVTGGDARTAGFALINTLDSWSKTDKDRPDGQDAPKGLLTQFPSREAQKVGNLLAQESWKIWEALWDPYSRMPILHDFYLKMWQLSKPRLPHDLIILDEAQDTNPPVLDVLLRQDAPVLALGDSQQSIYQWRNAVDAMKRLPGVSLPLTESFRFGQEVASLANEVLEMIGVGNPLVGKGGPSFVIDDVLEYSNGAILCRGNAGVIRETVAALDEGKRTAVVGGTREAVNLLYSAWDLFQGRPANHPELGIFRNWDELEKFAETEEGEGYKPLVRMVYQYLGGIPMLCRRLKPKKWGGETEFEEKDAEVVVSTAHKAKGREWDRVRMCDDFPQLVQEVSAGKFELDEEEANLVYVTITRARKRLNLGGYGMKMREDRARLALRNGSALPPMNELKPPPDDLGLF